MPSTTAEHGDIHDHGDIGDVSPTGERTALIGVNCRAAVGAGGGHDPASGSLLSTVDAVSGQSPVRTWDTYLDFDARPYPGQHPVHGVEIVPAAVLLTTLLAASPASPASPVPSWPAGGQASRGVTTREPVVRELTEVSLRIPISVDLPRAVRILRQGDRLRISSRTLNPDGDAAGGDEQPWTTHTAAVAARGAAPADRFDARYDLPAIRSRCPHRLDWAELAERFRQIGIGGFGFGWTIDDLRLGNGELSATICADPSGGHTARWTELVDGALTCTPLLLPQDGTVRMPAHIERFTARGELPDTVVVHAWRCGRSPCDTLHAVITSPSGRPLVTVGGLRFCELHGAAAVAATPRHPV
jgi:6-methylsalicylic acid synthase